MTPVLLRHRSQNFRRRFKGSGATTIKFSLPLCVSANKALVCMEFCSSYSCEKKSELPLGKRYFFLILVFCSEILYTIVTHADRVAKNPKASHFDCGAMTETNLYALNQVQQCHITSEELEVSQTKIIFYTKHFREELNATKCRIQHQRKKWHC